MSTATKTKTKPPKRPAIDPLRAAEQLKFAADGTRLGILILLAEAERDVATLVADTGALSQPAVSHHLSILRAARLVEPTRHGKRRVYALTDAGRRLVDAVVALGS